MPLIQWIMQNLQPTSQGVVIDGVALVKKLVNLAGSGGVEISGTSDSIVIKSLDGVIIDGFSPSQSEFNSSFTGGVELNGEAFAEFNSILRNIIPYSLGDTVYTSNGLQYMVLGFFWNMDKELTYEITNYNETIFVPESFVYLDRSIYYQTQLSIIDRNIANLSA
jgi:hypothetical protein